MGWDATAGYGKLDPKIKRAFYRASRLVALQAKEVDGLLHAGTLSCKDCARMLEKATNRSTWQRDWDAQEVKEIATQANWNFEVDDEDRWAYLSAMKFLNLCAKYSLSIGFTW